jgi:hypothetical protein
MSPELHLLFAIRILVFLARPLDLPRREGLLERFILFLLETTSALNQWNLW